MDINYQMALQQTQAILTTSGFRNPICSQINYHQKCLLVRENQRMARHCQLAETAQTMNNKSLHTTTDEQLLLDELEFFFETFLILIKFGKQNFKSIKPVLSHINYEEGVDEGQTLLTPSILFLVFSVLVCLLEGVLFLKKINQICFFEENMFFDLLIKCKCLKILV